MPNTCRHCSADIELEGDLWVGALSGDEGGTYDHCPDNAAEVHEPSASKPAEQGGPGTVQVLEMARACFHPLSCSGCQRNGRACGLHRVGDTGHTRCSGN